MGIVVLNKNNKNSGCDENGMTTCILNCPPNKRCSKNINSLPRIHTPLHCGSHLPSTLDSRCPTKQVLYLSRLAWLLNTWLSQLLLELSLLPEDVHPLSYSLYKSFRLTIACVSSVLPSAL